MSATTLSPIAKRFAWKEYRTLRSFWIAAFVIAVLVQAVTIALAPRSSDPVPTVIGIALATAALYAVGVAATTFSMEHEEETYAYLTGLPTRWFPLFAGKFCFAATSALLLAAALLACAWFFARVFVQMHTPSAEMTSQLFAGFGFAIVEMLAWGLFFSLLIRQPLLAALLAIGAESLAVTWAANYFGERSITFLTLGSYAGVLGPRLAIAICVLAIDILLARRWLVHEQYGSASETSVASSSTPALLGFLDHFRAAVARIAKLARQYSPRVFGHLIWQAWRQAWKPMLVMSLIVPGLCYMLVLVANIWNVTNRVRFSHLVMSPYPIALLAMAIYWSVVFYADQRQNKYRFLAEHAVWPRYVWLSRLLVWSLPIVILAVLATVGSITASFNFFAMVRHEFNQIVRYDRSWETRYLAEQWRDLDVVSRSLAFGLWGAGLGFGLGQATSLFFRRALVAGFAALVLALPIWVWGFAAWTWELKPLVFLLPIILGLVAATWLRAPDWLVDRNSIASWAKVAAALGAPVAFIAWQLPAARTISQVEQYQALSNLDGSIIVPDRRLTALLFHADQVVSHWVEKSADAVPKDNQVTIDRLVRLSELIEFPPRPATWLDEYGAGRDSYGDLYMDTHGDKYAAMVVAANQKILKESVPLALCDYRLTVSDGSFGRIQGLQHWLNEAGRVATRNGKLDVALEYHLAALTLWERLWTGQSTNTFQSFRQQQQQGLVDWAGAEGQTSARIKRAIAALDKIYPPVKDRQSEPDSVDSIADWTPPPQILATYEQLRAIVRGKQPSRLLDKDAGFDDYVAVTLNELPLERARALTILDFLTITQVAQWRDVIWRVNQQLLQEWSKDNLLNSGERKNEDMGSSLRDTIRVANSGSYGRAADDQWHSDEPPHSWLRTSPFLRRDLQKNRNFGEWLASVVNAEVAAWGLRQQLALLAYRADHGKYPEIIADLVPDYLSFVPIDPYSGRAFEYRPQGLSLELRSYGDASNSIPAGTPLVWSIGANGQQLERTFLTEGSDPADANEERIVRKEIYQLDSYANWYSSLLFPLPKLPSNPSKSLVP